MENNQYTALATTINIFTESIISVKPAIERVAKTLVIMANACYKPFLTPKQYHLMLHSKKRVRNKWRNVASKRIKKFKDKYNENLI